MSHSILQLCRGLGVVGPVTPKSFASHAYTLVAIDYFSKWVEVMPLKELKKKTMVNFIRSNIIYQYEVSWYIIIDNGKPFYNKLMSKHYKRFGFKQHNSYIYNALVNGLAKAFNKTIFKLLKKIIDKLKND